MAIRIVFRPQAEDDLLGLYEYIADASGRDRAGAYIDRIEAACRALQTFPERGRRRDDLHPGLLTLGFERRVLIAYRVVGQDVEILHILYGGQDFERLLGGA